MAYIAGVELGGTTCIAAIAELRQPTKIIASFETETEARPQETLSSLTKFLKEKRTSLGIASYEAIGIASFGPVDLCRSSPTYGFITTTPKEPWRNTDIVGFFKREFGDSTPIGFDTDVNAPAMAELARIEHDPVDPPTVVYITVGTGVGVGAAVCGKPLHGLLHLEGGHTMVPPLDGDSYPGGCGFNHGYCVEGMVHSKAIAARAKVSQRELHTLTDDHEVWEKAGYYLGVLCLNVTYLLSPHVIVLGGGILKRRVLFSKARRWFKDLMKGYLEVEKFKTEDGLASYIRGSVFGDSTGIIGALELASKEVCNRN